MTRTVIDDETGQEVELYTKEELESFAAEAKKASEAEIEAAKKAAEEAERIKKEKLDEFMKGKQAADLEKANILSAAEEAKKTASEALAYAQSMKQEALTDVKSSEMTKYVGNDPKLRAELEDACKLINIEIKGKEDVIKLVSLAAQMKGFTGGVKPVGMGGISFSGGYAPRFDATEDREKDADYQKFKSALGFDSIIPKKEDKK